MGGGSFIPKQQNWHWMKDDAAQPVDQWANENTTFTMSSNDDILRMRVTIAETGDKGANNVSLKFEYSPGDEASWATPGAANGWDYANGQATEGNTLTTNHCTDTTGKGEYVESSGGALTFDFAASTSYEFDFAVTPGSGVVGNTLYYFRILVNDAEVVLNDGETHPNCTTAAAAQHNTETPAVQTFTSSQGTPLTVTAQRNITETPAVQTYTASQGTPLTITAQKNVTCTIAAEQAVAVSQPSPITVSAIKNVTETPAVQTATASQGTPLTVSAVKNITETPAVQAVTTSQGLPISVTTGGDITVTPSVQTVTFSQPVATVQTLTLIAPSVQTVSFSQPSPTVTTEEFVTVTVDALLFTAVIPSPTVTAQGAVVVPHFHDGYFLGLQI